MEDKTFELLTKMYSEFSEKFTNLENSQIALDKKITYLENGQRKIETVLENDIKKDIKVLYEGYQQTYEKLTVVETKVVEFSNKFKKQEFEIKVIKGGKH